VLVTAADHREVVIARWIVVGLLVLLGWPAVLMAVALVQELLGRRRAKR